MNGASVELSIPFPTKREAEIAFQTIKVDLEPLTKNRAIIAYHLSSNVLKILFHEKEVRKVRVAVTSFFDSLILVTETMKEFGPPAPAYDYYGYVHYSSDSE